MAKAFEETKSRLAAEPKRWLVTGAAGFIGSHLLENLLNLGQTVAGFDSFATGHRHNLEDVRKAVGEAAWKNFRFVEGDIRNPEACREAVAGADYVLHQAALGSVPRSIADPLTSHLVNVDGTLNMLMAARDAGVKRFVYASSSSVYGDEAAMPKVEQRIGKALSPYALTKHVNELYAGIFESVYGLQTAGLRYFNVFGARQDPNGPYAAVIPKWTQSLIKGEPVIVNGKGEISRDFCYVLNVVQANMLAATVPAERLNRAASRVFNVALDDRTTLVDLFYHIRDRLVPHLPKLKGVEPVFGPYRPGDIMHSQADIGRAREILGFEPTHTVAQGLDIAMDWYRANLG